MNISGCCWKCCSPGRWDKRWQQQRVQSLHSWWYQFTDYTVSADLRSDCIRSEAFRWKYLPYNGEERVKQHRLLTGYLNITPNRRLSWLWYGVFWGHMGSVCCINHLSEKVLANEASGWTLTRSGVPPWEGHGAWWKMLSLPSTIPGSSLLLRCASPELRIKKTRVYYKGGGGGGDVRLGFTPSASCSTNSSRCALAPQISL